MHPGLEPGVLEPAAHHAAGLECHFAVANARQSRRAPRRRSAMIVATATGLATLVAVLFVATSSHERELAGVPTALMGEEATSALHEMRSLARAQNRAVLHQVASTKHHAEDFDAQFDAAFNQGYKDAGRKAHEVSRLPHARDVQWQQEGLVRRSCQILSCSHPST